MTGDYTGPRMTSTQLQGRILKHAKQAGWEFRYHTLAIRRARDGRHVTPVTSKGFPDLVLIRPPELLVAELKNDGEQPRPEQWDWLEAFSACGVETHVWRPKDWLRIQKRLDERKAA